MSEHYDVIIIGGGLAGLTCGAKLTHAGLSILLLEQHHVPGGCATTYRHKDFNIEVGLHEMDGFAGGNLKNKIFRELEVFDNVSFISTGSFYRFVHNDLDFVVPHEPSKAVELFIGKFPSQTEGIRLYFDRIINNRKYRKPDSLAKENLGDFLDSIISDDELKLALTGNLMAFSDDPYNISLDYFALAQGSFHNSSGVFIKNGSQELSNYLLSYIVNRGGKVLLKHRADKIIARNNHVSGVEYHHVSDPGKILMATADFVVANNSVLNVLSQMISSTDLTDRFNPFEISPSMFTLYLCFSKPLKDLGNPAYCTSFIPPDIKNLRDIGLSNKSGFDKKHFVLTDYSQIDSGLAPEGKSFAVIVCTDYADYWRSFSREDYLAEKERVSGMLLRRLDQYIPGASKNLEYSDAATPLTIERYTSNPSGAIYGFAQTTRRPSNPNISESISNLYLASAWDKFGGGFSGVIYSGYFTGIEIIRHARNR
ncbi:MAG: NAD(P)/FAD-dependent oxidoreductase [bacterium]